MRKIIENELSKVQFVDVSRIKEGESFIIKKRIPTIFEYNKEYIIELDDDLLIKGKNEILEANYNKGKIPSTKLLHGEVEKQLGKLILFVGYSFDGRNDLDIYWRGYLPKDKIKIIEVK